MSPQFSLAKGVLLAATACVGLLAAPQFASAQPGPGYGPDDGYNQGGTDYDPCARTQADRSVVGGLLGAAAGATIGNSVTHGGARVGGTIIGGVAGAAVGAGIGHASAACDSSQPVPYAGDQYARDQYSNSQYQGGQYQGPPQQDSDYGPPPPPPPPPPGAYVPPDDGRYADRGDDRDYGPPPAQPGQQCQMVEDRAFFPDGTTESSTVRACRDQRGHWRVQD